MCRPFLQILTLAISDHVISHTRFQTWPLDRNYVIITQIRAQTKNSSNPVPIPIVLFLSQSFGIGTINTFIHSSSFLENHTRLQIKMGKVYTRFQTCDGDEKRGQTPRPPTTLQHFSLEKRPGRRLKQCHFQHYNVQFFVSINVFLCINSARIPTGANYRFLILIKTSYRDDTSLWFQSVL